MGRAATAGPKPVGSLRRVPVGRSLLVGLLVVIALAATGGCGADSESRTPAASTSTNEPDGSGVTAPPDESTVPGRARAADRDLVDPDAGLVQEYIDRDGDHTTLFIGDSVLVSVTDDLAGLVDGDLVFDAAECRRLAETVRIRCGGTSVREISSGIVRIETAMTILAASGIVPDAVVLVLANNSTVEPEHLDEAMDLLDAVPQVWWVNARIRGYGRQDLNNEALDDLARRESNADVIDWYGESDDPDWFRDHVHPNDRGQRSLADLIGDHLDCGCVP